MESWDAIIVGSGPNGLSAGIRLASAGFSTLILEGHERPGGGMRTDELTLPGFHHDVCSACHPMGILSPWFRSLRLEQHGLRWCSSPVSVAHPLDHEPAVLLRHDLEQTQVELTVDGDRYHRLIKPLLAHPGPLIEDILSPLGVPRAPLSLARFGWYGWRSAEKLGELFEGHRARALLAGCAAHSIQPLDNLFTGAVGLVFMLTAHIEPWPVVQGGTERLTEALLTQFRACGGTIRTGTWVRKLDELPRSRVVLFDTDPHQMASIARDALPSRYRLALERYRMGPGVFKIDWALDGPIPWADPRVAEATTVHLGGTMEEIVAGERAMSMGRHAEKPFVLVVQQSAVDPTRAPAGKHTGYAYIHVPPGSNLDQTETVEAQVERFAPGFRDLILARHTMNAPAFEAYNPNAVGGAAVTGGPADIWQLFTRPTARLDPYSTPNPKLYICSASTPPGGGVHGMCGLLAANSAIGAMHDGRA